MAENTEKKPEDLEATDVTELEDGALDSASGGGLLQPDQDFNEPNTNCGNTQCCG
jgi:hypothetical protein